MRQVLGFKNALAASFESINRWLNRAAVYAQAKILYNYIQVPGHQVQTHLQIGNDCHAHDH
jgi:hypothetical protein